MHLINPKRVIFYCATEKEKRDLLAYLEKHFRVGDGARVVPTPCYLFAGCSIEGTISTVAWGSARERLDWLTRADKDYCQLTGPKAPITHKLVIDGKEVTISDESYKALKEALNG
jgi:hypothetical protein